MDGAPSATIRSCGDFCSTGSMYFFMLDPFFDVLNVLEQVFRVCTQPQSTQKRCGIIYENVYISMNFHDFRSFSWFGYRAGHDCHVILMTGNASSNVFNHSKSIENLLKHFQNIEKWIQHEQIHRPCAAEVPTAPNSRGGSSIQKNTR